MTGPGVLVPADDSDDSHDPDDRVDPGDSDGTHWTEDADPPGRGSERNPDGHQQSHRDWTNAPTATGGASAGGEVGPGGFVFGNDTTERDSPSGSRQADRVKSALARVAGTDDEAVVERAVAAVEDIDAVVAFVERDGLAQLERSIRAATDPDVRARGERALAAFRRFAAAAEDADDSPSDHFRRGRDTDIRAGTEAPRE